MSASFMPVKYGRTWRSSTPQYPRRVVGRSLTVVAHQRSAHSSKLCRRLLGVYPFPAACVRAGVVQEVLSVPLQVERLAA
jgi:hypothetical protein